VGLGGRGQASVGLNAHLFAESHAWARFSPCRQWRYQLGRTWDESKPRANFLMLNPSTADEVVLDATVTRCVDFSRRWSYGGLIVTNLFAWRATEPADMKASVDPVGPDNDTAILDAANKCAVVVCAWGNHGTWLGRNEKVLELLRSAGIRPHALKINTATGHPAHPLYLPQTLTPMEYL
jgi:hypothetical protein